MQRHLSKEPDQPSTVYLLFLFSFLFAILQKPKGAWNSYRCIYMYIRKWVVNWCPSFSGPAKKFINLLIRYLRIQLTHHLLPLLHHSQTINSLPFCPLYLLFARLSVSLLAAICCPGLLHKGGTTGSEGAHGIDELSSIHSLPVPQRTVPPQP